MNQLRAMLLHNDGYWEYVYSYGKLDSSKDGKDTCLVFEEEVLKLPDNFLFREEDTTEFARQESWYYKYKDNVLYGLGSYNKGYKKPSYPLVVNVARDSTFIHMFHYSYRRHIKPYFDYYYIEKINTDTILISCSDYYHVNKKELYKTRHVYINKPAS